MLATDQVHVFYSDHSGKIWDSWYERATGRWNLDQINLGGFIAGQMAYNDPFSLVYLNQIHILYYGGAGKISHIWYGGGK
jgi:hypothetical protein